MIDKFFIHTNDTIWKFLSEIGKSKEIYSCYSFHEMDDYTVFFYATSTEIVLVYLDIVDEGTVDSRLIPIKKHTAIQVSFEYFFCIVSPP